MPAKTEPPVLYLALVLVSAVTACESGTVGAAGSDPATDGDATSTSTGEPSTGEADATADVDTSSAAESGSTTGGDTEVCGGDGLPPCPPPEWTCGSQFYGDEICQCGCGVVDVDCESAELSECAYALCPDGQALDPGQTVVCTDVPEVPSEWECSAASFGDSVCDCGCGVLDFDCETALAASCADTQCPEAFALDPENNALCLPPPADAVLNPSFEEVPAGFGDVPGWTVLDDIGGLASVAVVGAGQTTAPDGVRALWLESTNARIVGARTVSSSPFLPPPGTCTVIVAVGDSNESSEFTDFGQVRVRAPALPFPLDLVAEVDIDNRGEGGVSPPVDGYADATLGFSVDGETMYHVEIRTRGSFGTRSYHADDVRISCTPS